LVGCGILGGVLGWTAAWSHDKGRLTLVDTIAVFTVVGLAALFVWHFYIWKTDRLTVRPDA